MSVSISDKFLKYVSKFGYNASVVSGVRSLVGKVSIVTSQDIDEVLISSDFRESEFSKEKLESIIAELRSVMFLKNNNFQNIKLIRGSKTKSCDIYAENGHEKFDVEVTCLTATHSRGKNGLSYVFDDDKFLREFTDRINSKLNQLNAGISNHKMLVFVVNRYPEIALTNGQEYEKLIRVAYEQSSLASKYYLGLVTGDFDFIYPNLN